MVEAQTIWLKLIRQLQQRPPHADRRALANQFGESETLWRKNDDRRAVLEPSHFLALAQRGLAGDLGVSSITRAEEGIEKAQSDASDQDSGHRHQRNDMARS